MFIIIVPPRGQWMDYRCRLVRKFIHCFGAYRPRGKIGLSYSLGLWDFIFRARFTSFNAHASLLIFFSFFVIIHSCCSYAQAFWKTLVHEFPISYSHTEFYTAFFDSATTRTVTRIRTYSPGICFSNMVNSLQSIIFKINETILKHTI